MLNNNLVGGWAFPSEKWWSSSVGIMKFPIYGKSVFTVIYTSTAGILYFDITATVLWKGVTCQQIHLDSPNLSANGLW